MYNLMNKYRVIVAGSKFGKIFDMLYNLEKENYGKTFREYYGMRLPEWKTDVVIKVQIPDKYDKMSAPYLYVESRFGRVPWKETYIELFAENWQLVKFIPDNQSNKTVENIKSSIMNDIDKQFKAEYQNKMNKETIDAIKKQAVATPCGCKCKAEESSDNKITNFSDFIEKFIESIDFKQANTSIDDILKMLD